MVPCVAALCGDTNEHVRSSLASVVLGLAPLLGRETGTRLLLPLFLQLLRDEKSDVRLNLLAKLPVLDKVGRMGGCAAAQEWEEPFSFNLRVYILSYCCVYFAL